MDELHDGGIRDKSTLESLKSAHYIFCAHWMYLTRLIQPFNQS